MTWQTLLKALPDPESITGMLHREEAIDVILTQAKGEDKTNLIRVRNKARRLAQKKDIPKGFDADQQKDIVQNAERLAAKLSKQIKEANKKAQTTLEGKLTQIIEEEDIAGLKAFVGSSPVNKWKAKSGKAKLLKDNKEAILEFVGLDNSVLFYYTTPEYKLTASKAQGDNNWSDKVNKIKEELSDIDVKVEGDDTITIVFPDKVSASDMKHINDVAQLTGKASSKESLVIFSKNGTATRSPLLKLFDIKVTQQVRDKVAIASGKDYRNNVTTPQHALLYLEMLTGYGLRKDIIFMPTPNISGGSKKVITNSKIRLLGSSARPRLSSSLRALFKTKTFDLEQLMKQGTIESQIKYIAPRMRAILESEKDLEIAGLSSDDINNLRNRFNKSPEQEEDKGRKGEFPSFVRGLKGTKYEATFKQLNSFLIGSRPNLFTQEEVEKITSLKGRNPIAIKKALKAYYGTEIKTLLARLIGEALRASEPFEKIEGGYKLKQVEGMSFNDTRDLVHELKLIRQQMPQEMQEQVDVNLKDSLSSYTKNYKVSESGAPNPTDMLHFLYVLDLYYGRTGFKSSAIRFRKGEGEVQEVLDKAKEQFPNIINAFVQQVVKKIDDILDNKEEYQQALSYEKDKRAYILFDKLKQNGLIISRTERGEENE